MKIIHGAMEEILTPLADYNLKGFRCIDNDGKSSYCHPTICSYCCDIPEEKDISGIRHNMNTKFLCIRCLTSLEGIKEMRIGQERRADEMGIAMENGRNTEREENEEDEEENLKRWSLTKYEPFIIKMSENYNSFVLDGVYVIFTFEILHNLHLGMSKLLKKATYMYVCSEREVNFRFKRGRKKKKIGRMRNCLLYTSPSPRDA